MVVISYNVEKINTHLIDLQKEHLLGKKLFPLKYHHYIHREEKVLSLIEDFQGLLTLQVLTKT